ncbi:MAG: hypothetical protein R3200_13200 [Xanthomonadales bacterium]|nr:hypothetical protein [Xanthomonadales bacterium]
MKPLIRPACWRPALLLGSIAALSGCVTAQVEEFMTTRPVLSGDDTVVIMTNRQDAVVEAEKSFTDCIYSELGGARAQVNIISESQFRDEMFPWFEPRLAPTEPQAFGTLLANNRIAERVEQLKVRYLVWIHGESEAMNKQGMMTCTLSPAGGGCLGVLSWDNNSDYEATIWDVDAGESLGIISAEATGTSVIPAIGVPIPLIARTKTASCKGLADQLRLVLSTDA